MWAPPPAKPPPPGWWTERKWDAAVAATLAERDAAREAKWALPALAARAGRYLRAVDAALAASPCDCVAEGYRAGCVRCRPPVDSRRTGPEPDHGFDGRSWRSEVQYRDSVILSVR
jgi:hypothetical protein